MLTVDCRLPVETEVDIPAGGPAESRVDLAVSGVGGPIIFFVTSDAFPELVSLLILDVEDEPRMLRLVVLGPLSGVLGLLRPPVMKGCLIALCGFSLRSGSQMRHLAMKSTKSVSSHRSTCCNDFEPGRLRRPLELTTGRGAPEESKRNQSTQA